jgi:histidinol-phosphatase (PHP family)
MTTTLGSVADSGPTAERSLGTTEDNPQAMPANQRDEGRALPPDNHVHTHWSWDTAASVTMRAACERAVAVGLPAIAFTEHLDFTVWTEDDRAHAEGLTHRHSAQQLPIDVEGYAAELAECRDRFPGLRILSGVEVGEPHLFAGSLATHLRTAPADRILGSLHSLPDGGLLVGAGRLLYPDAHGTMRRYLAEVVRMVESSDVFQVLAHVDFPRRYWPGGRDRYEEKDFEEEYRAVFRALAGTGRAFELNTSSPLASVDQVRWFYEEGGEAVSFGSDAHGSQAVGQRFDIAVDVVEAAGFRPGRDRFDFWRR